MFHRKKHPAIFLTACTILAATATLGRGNTVNAEEKSTGVVTAQMSQDTSDLLVSSLVFQKGGAAYTQPFMNFLPVGAQPKSGLEGYSLLMANPKVLEQYIQVLNELLADELHRESSLELMTEQTGVYHDRVFAYQIGTEARKQLEEQIAYHAIGAMTGDVIINLDEISLTPVTIKAEDRQVTISLAGTYATSYATSSAARCNNVELAAANFNGTIANPGEVISCSNLFQRRTIANGYRVAGIFINGEKGEGVGGGVCQVSSTVYAAALQAGLDIVERHAHSLPVSYIPRGMDATISYPTLDLRIRNNKEVPVLYKATTQDKKVIVEVFQIENML